MLEQLDRLAWVIGLSGHVFCPAAYALIASYVYPEPSLPTVEAMRTGSLPVPLRILPAAAS